MRLKKIQFIENFGKPNQWKLEPVAFDDVNLVVGKNSAGKSRTLSIIIVLSRLVSNRMKPTQALAEWKCWFEHDGDEYLYELEVDNGNVKREIFRKNGRSLLTRGTDGSGKIFSEKTGKQSEYKTPTSDLAVVNRRGDNKSYPFLDKLHDWGASVFSYFFGTPLGQPMYAMSVISPAVIDLHDQNSVVAIYTLGVKEFKQKFVNAVRKDMATLGYQNDLITTAAPTHVKPVPVGIIGLSLKESDLPGPANQGDMSQGMFRALSVIIQFNYASMSAKAGCVIVDDIGEGLDFERSCDLIDILTKKAASKSGAAKVQLILSTNDRFVMNRVPLRYWSVLKRISNNVSVYNYSNSKRHFDDFKFTGLNNFDFFSMNFVEENLDELEKVG